MRKIENEGKKRQMNKKIEIDISGQIQQINHNSALGFYRDNGIERSVYLNSKVKKEIIKKYKGQVTNLIEKLHCILIYYCIKDFLDDVEEILICKDVSFRRVKNLLPLLFKEKNYLNRIKISQRKGEDAKSLGHKIALRTFRRKRYACLIIKKEMIENVLFEFRKIPNFWGSQKSLISDIRNKKISKSGHPKMLNPIMLCLKAKGIRTAPPGNSYFIMNNKEYINFLFCSNKR